MNNTEIKTRHGLILQTLTAKALGLAGYEFVENHQYDEISEVPDFLIPDGDSPRFMIEVHQTDARDSFRMKILRGFTAVIESKVHYSDDLICVNILFGDPANEVPGSNLKALCGFFDLNIIPRYAANDRKIIEELETVSLRLAGTEDLSVSDGADQAYDACPGGVAELSQILENLMEVAKANASLNRLWRSERTRMRRLGPPPRPGERSYHKRNILRSLFFTDSQFEELVTKKDSSDYSRSLSDQLVRCKLAEWEEQIWGDELVVETEFAEFIKEPESYRLRKFSIDRLNKDKAMRWYFEDIRNATRREKMASIFLEQIHMSKMVDALYQNMVHGDYGGIQHERTWFVDLITRDIDISLNVLSRRIYTEYKNPGNLGDPISHIAPRTDRFLSLDRKNKKIYAKEIHKACLAIAEKNNLIVGQESIIGLSKKLLELRLNGAIKLQKLNPLYLVVESICQQADLSISYGGTKSIISDLAEAARSVGKFDLFHITNGEKTIILNAVAVKDQNGDHKSKEWGARRRAVGYRLKDGKAQIAEFHEAVFILDGDWEAKHVERLHRAGWTHIIRLNQIEDTFREIFGMAGKDEMQIIKEPLPLAAEDDDQFPKIKQ